MHADLGVDRSLVFRRLTIAITYAPVSSPNNETVIMQELKICDSNPFLKMQNRHNLTLIASVEPVKGSVAAAHVNFIL